MAADCSGRSAPPHEVGALASALWLGILGTSVVAQLVVARLGHARVFVAGSAEATLALATLPLSAHYSAWLAEAAPAARCFNRRSAPWPTRSACGARWRWPECW
jgi:hypothetical protein